MSEQKNEEDVRMSIRVTGSMDERIKQAVEKEKNKKLSKSTVIRIALDAGLQQEFGV